MSPQTNDQWAGWSSDASATTPLHEINRRFYDRLWTSSRFYGPQWFNTWPMVRELVQGTKHRLEVGPGLRPRLPLDDGSVAMELSAHAAGVLARHGGNVVGGRLPELPFADGSFDLVCALDVIEHVDDDRAVLAGLSRMLTDGGVLLCSVPLHPGLWTRIDRIVGHARRYDPDQLLWLLAEHGLEVESSAVYGMQPRSAVLAEVGAFFLRRWRWVALRWYTRFFMPIAIRMQNPLQWKPGFDLPDGADEVILVCRKHVHWPKRA